MTAHTAPGDLSHPTAPGHRTGPSGGSPEHSSRDVYELSERLSVAFECAGGRRRAFIARQMDPLVARHPDDAALAGSPPPAVVVHDLSTNTAKDLLAHPVTEVLNPARDHVLSAFDGRELHLVRDGRVCSIPDPLRQRPAVVACEEQFPLEALFGKVVRPVLQIALLGGGCVAVHGACVEIAGRAVLLAGWSETGKTEIALALVEQGAAFLSDKWTLLDSGGAASVFPIGVGVRRWALPYLPRLARCLPPAAQRRFRAAALATMASRAARLASSRAGATGRAGELLEQALDQTNRAALTPSELRAVYGQQDDPTRRLPLGLLVLLTTAPTREVSVRRVSAEWAAARLARAAAYERRDFFALLQRRAYAEPLVESDPVAEAIAAERRLLEPVLASVPAIEVRTAFPSDPRAAAAAVSRWL